MSEQDPTKVNLYSPIIAAATIVMLRNGPNGPEVLMLQRLESLNAFGGLWVFPGGKVEAADRVQAGSLQAPQDALRSRDLFSTFTGEYALKEEQTSRVAAIRETFEETGLLYAETVEATFSQRYARHREDWRVAVARDASAFAALLTAEGVQPDLQALHYWIRMVPPRDIPRRFDTDFFLAHAPEGQEPIADLNESMTVRWVPFTQAEPEQINCAPVTRIVLLELRLRYQQYGSLESFITAARQDPCRILYTRRGLFDGVMYAFFPWDPHYAEVSGDGDLWTAPACARMDGLPGRLPIQDGLFSTNTPTTS
jgi:8-oxo-dGTP pyrophosphatase MutT (NUDIX family)